MMVVELPSYTNISTNISNHTQKHTNIYKVDLIVTGGKLLFGKFGLSPKL